MSASVFRRKKPNRWTVLAVWGLAAGCGMGWAQETMPRFAVRGVVVNSVTGQPIARALVDANEDATLTDGEGRFELRLSDQEAQITIRRPGFSDKQEENTHRVRVGPEMPELQFSLLPAASLTGHVTMSAGDVAAGIQFTAYRKQVVDGRTRWMPAGMAETNSEGVFQYNGVEAPAWYVMCSMEVREHHVFARPSETLLGYPSTCFPGGGDFLSAEAVNVMPGQQKDMEIVLTRQQLYPVRVSMQNPPFSAGGARVEVYDRAGRPTPVQPRWTAKNGTAWAELELPNGSYSLELQFGGKQPAFGRVDFRVANGPVTGLSMNLLPMHPVGVEIRKDFTAVAEQRGVHSFWDGNGSAPVNLSLVPRDSLLDGPMGMGLSHAAGAGPDVFQMEGVRPGRYLVRVDPFDGYVASVTSGGSDLSRDPLIVGAGGTAAPIEITLRNDWGQIECDVRATNANAAAGVEIGLISLIAIPQFATASRIPQMTLGNPGQFTWNQLPPGTYRVLAMDRNPEINLDDAKDVARWSGLGQVVKVNPGSTATVQLDVIHVGDSGANP